MIISTNARVILAVFFIAIIVGIFGLSSNRINSCDKMMEIARNNERILYLKNWVNKKLSEHDFLVQMGQLGQSNALDDLRHFEQLGLDVDLLGIEKKYAFVWLNRGIDQSDRYMDRAAVKSVSIGEGRSSVVIKLIDSGDYGIDGLENIQDAIKYSEKDIMVICR